MALFDTLFLLLTGLIALYLTGRFSLRWRQQGNAHDMFYAIAFLVLFVSGLLLISFGYGILASPYVLTVASLIPLGISLGLVYQHYPTWKRPFIGFALAGLLGIAFTSIGGLETAKKIAVPLVHGVAGLIIFLGPLFAQNAPGSFAWVGVGGALIGLGGVALAFLTSGSQLLFFSQSFVLLILAPLLLLMSTAFAIGFFWDFKGA